MTKKQKRDLRKLVKRFNRLHEGICNGVPQGFAIGSPAYEEWFKGSEGGDIVLTPVTEMQKVLVRLFLMGLDVKLSTVVSKISGKLTPVHSQFGVGDFRGMDDEGYYWGGYRKFIARRFTRFYNQVVKEYQ